MKAAPTLKMFHVKHSETASYQQLLTSCQQLYQHEQNIEIHCKLQVYNNYFTYYSVYKSFIGRKYQQTLVFEI